MKKDRCINPQILSVIAALGHTEYLCIADCGLPVPKDVPVIDISLQAGNPGFLDVLKTVNQELVTESYIIASEIMEKNAEMFRNIKEELKGLSYSDTPHETFKQLTKQAKCVIRTGETTSYANIILIGGVNF